MLRRVGRGPRRARVEGARWILAVSILLPALAAACDATSDQVLEEGRRRRLEQVGVETFDSAGGAKLAGMSAIRRIDVDRLDMRALKGDTLSAGFRTFTARCGACHDIPDPTSKTAGEWSNVLSRMSHNQEAAGLLPWTDGQRALILEYVQRHSSR